jgi:hypothetical protein
MDFTYRHTWTGRAYVAFIVGWHPQTTKHVRLAMILLRMSFWKRDRQGHPVALSQLRAHSNSPSTPP